MSVLSQTLEPYEVIVCDDCSTDRSWDIINLLASKFTCLRMYRHKENIGAYANGTFGGKVWSGDWVCLMDGDDRWDPRKLECEWEALSHQPEAQLAYSGVRVIDEQGETLDIWRPPSQGEAPQGDVLCEVMSRRFFPNTRSVFRNELVSSHAFNEEGDGDDSLEHLWDWDRKIRYVKRFSVAYSGAVLVDYRVHKRGIHNSASSVLHRAHRAIYEKHMHALKGVVGGREFWASVSIELLLGRQQLRLLCSERAERYSLTAVYERCLSAMEEVRVAARGQYRKRLDLEIGYVVPYMLMESVVARSPTRVLRTLKLLARPLIVCQMVPIVFGYLARKLARVWGGRVPAQ